MARKTLARYVKALSRPVEDGAEKPEALAMPNEVAEYLRVSESTLAHWRRTQQGPKWFGVGQQRRYQWEDVETWLAEQLGRGDAA